MRILLCLLLLCTASLSAGAYTHFGVSSATKEWDPHPSVGFGNRTSHGHHGWDLKGSYTPSHTSHKIDMKGTYLMYPQPQAKHRIYFGGGVGGHASFNQLGIQDKWMSGEAVAGIELSRSETMRSYLQLEHSQPIGTKRAAETRLVLGFGF